MSSLDQHDFDEEGEHWPDGCELCIEQEMTVQCRCDCGICCQSLLIEASLRDAEREPMFAEHGKPMYDDCCGTGPRELIGYILNGQDGPCTFYDQETRRCTIYETRPLCCRTYCCDLLNHRFRSPMDLEAEGISPSLDLGNDVPRYCRDAVLELTSNVPVSPRPEREDPRKTHDRMNRVGQIAEVSEDDWRDAVESRVVPLSATNCFVITTAPNQLRFCWRIGGRFYARQLNPNETEQVLEAIRWLAQAERR